jgi:hypothetical protein
MSSNNSQDPLAAAKQAERDLNSYQAKQGLNTNSDSGMLALPSLQHLPHHHFTLKKKATNILSSTANESGVNE